MQLKKHDLPTSALDNSSSSFDIHLDHTPYDELLIKKHCQYLQLLPEEFYEKEDKKKLLENKASLQFAEKILPGIVSIDDNDDDYDTEEDEDEDEGKIYFDLT